MAKNPRGEAKDKPARKSASKKQRSTKSKVTKRKLHDNGHILAWTDDPTNNDLVEQPTPNLSAKTFALQIQGVAPPAEVYDTSTEEFRYWNAAEALRRGVEFWAAVVPSGTNWQPGASLPVFLDRGRDLNAYYDRQSLSFFHDTAGGREIFSGESPDILCHELGHAVLDAIRPELFDAMSIEVASFHEAFGDMSAMLAALQIPSFRTAVLDETGRQLHRTSRLSRVAEQLGWAIRQRRPDAAEPDCLRNAANSFFYRDPETLPPSGPASVLSSEPHSFSRIFTGAFLEALSGMVLTHAATPTEADLVNVSQSIGQLLVDAVRTAPVVPDYYSQVSAHLLRADAWRYSGRYRDALKSAFVRRGILSLQSATNVVELQIAAIPVRAAPGGGASASAAPPAYEATGQLPQLALAGGVFGLGSKTLVLSSPAQPRRVTSASAAVDYGAVTPPNEQRATRSFAEDLFRRGRVDLKDHGDPEARVAHPFTRKTHELQEGGGNSLNLRRRCFDCGFDPI